MSDCFWEAVGVAGPPAMVWATVPRAAFRYVSGAPRVHLSSPWGQREFCADCGSQLLYRSQQPGPDLDLNLPTLDDPERWPPRRHTWVSSRLSWFRLDDGLPEHEGDGPGI